MQFDTPTPIPLSPAAQEHTLCANCSTLCGATAYGSAYAKGLYCSRICAAAAAYNPRLMVGSPYRELLTSRAAW